ncbi:Os04g0149400, partial [Oryza sativa Japonica Group]
SKMGDKKQVKLKVRGASETEVKNVLRQEFKESIEYRNYSKNPESSSLKVEVRGTVDVGKLYERLKKMASSVKIESVIPDDVKEEIERYKKDLERMKRQKEDLDIKLR